MSAAGDWFFAPAPGDIVWCRFPERKLSGRGPKLRPALVLRIGEADGHPVVEVAYGTSQKVDSLYAGEFAITPSDGPAYEAAGLSFPTKFNLRETFELDFNGEWFALPPGAPFGQTPKLGVLHPSLMRRARAAFEAAGRASL
jgi:PemK-like, MazF-like toxin of type II toxin-antitoxin system